MASRAYDFRRGTRREAYEFFAEISRQISVDIPAVPIVPALFLIDHANECSESVLATWAGRAVGAATLFFNGFVEFPRPILGTLYVLPRHRNNGIGLRLCEMALDRFQEIGKVPFYVDATTSGMHATLQKLPPAMVKEHPSYLEDELDLHWENRL